MLKCIVYAMCLRAYALRHIDLYYHFNSNMINIRIIINSLMIKSNTTDISLNKYDLSQLIKQIDPSLTQKHNRLRNKFISLLQMLIDFPILVNTITTVDKYEHNIIHNPKYL